jgi:hypothetical protein
MSHVWSFFWMMISVLLYFAYLVVMFQIVVDLFRDPERGALSKVLWVLALIFIPVVSALVYILVQGKSMERRRLQAAQRARADNEAYVKELAGTSPSDQIAKAKSLLDAGAISHEEFLRLKAKVLA